MSSHEEPVSTPSRAAFSDKLEDLGEALSILYILRNRSGRNNFRKKWPLIAEYLFGEELITFDENGVSFDELSLMGELEKKADEKWAALKHVISELPERSVSAGALQFDFVGQVIDQFGATIATFLFAENIIERVRPGLLAKETLDRKNKLSEINAISPEIATVNENLLSIPPVTTHLDIKPISGTLEDIRPIETSGPSHVDMAPKFNESESLTAEISIGTEVVTEQEVKDFVLNETEIVRNENFITKLEKGGLNKLFNELSANLSVGSVP